MVTCSTTICFEDIREVLKSIGDIERILARVALKSARPRDLERLKNALLALPALNQLLDEIPTPLIEQINEQSQPYPELSATLTAAIKDNPPVVIREGGVIATGYDEDLDELRGISENAAEFLVKLETEEREATGLSSLKVGYNRVSWLLYRDFSQPIGESARSVCASSNSQKCRTIYHARIENI